MDSAGGALLPFAPGASLHTMSVNDVRGRHVKWQEAT
jgi:hypothetical protein